VKFSTILLFIAFASEYSTISNANSEYHSQSDSTPRYQSSQQKPQWWQRTLIKFRRFERNVGCRKLPTNDIARCLSDTKDQESHIELAYADLNADGRVDLIARTVSLDACGARGCSTFVYLRERSELQAATPDVVSFGDAETCLSHRGPGIRFYYRDVAGKCFVVRKK
jgi:hypothetical protein